MRLSLGLGAFPLLAVLASGCGQPPEQATDAGQPSAPGAAEANADEVIAKTLKAVAEKGGSATATSSPAGGLNNNSISVGSRTIRTATDVPTNTMVQNSTAVIEFGGKKLEVEFEKQRILLDGTEQAKLPAGAREILVQSVGGKLTVTADGAALIPPSAAK
jgi:hypothetical protein